MNQSITAQKCNNNNNNKAIPNEKQADRILQETADWLQFRRSVIQGQAFSPSLFPKGPWSTAPQAQGSDDAGKDIQGPPRVAPPSPRPMLMQAEVSNPIYLPAKSGLLVFFLCFLGESSASTLFPEATPWSCRI